MVQVVDLKEHCLVVGIATIVEGGITAIVEQGIAAIVEAAYLLKQVGNIRAAEGVSSAIVEVAFATEEACQRQPEHIGASVSNCMVIELGEVIGKQVEQELVQVACKHP